MQSRECGGAAASDRESMKKFDEGLPRLGTPDGAGRPRAAQPQAGARRRSGGRRQSKLSAGGAATGGGAPAQRGGAPQRGVGGRRGCGRRRSRPSATAQPQAAQPGAGACRRGGERRRIVPSAGGTAAVAGMAPQTAVSRRQGRRRGPDSSPAGSARPRVRRPMRLGRAPTAAPFFHYQQVTLVGRGSIPHVT
jgi:hypothetical protein